MVYPLEKPIGPSFQFEITKIHPGPVAKKVAFFKPPHEMLSQKKPPSIVPLLESRGTARLNPIESSRDFVELGAAGN
jgi:hypothetical protein